MYQVPMHVWNEIAASQPTSRRWGGLMRMMPGELGNALAVHAGQLEKLGADSKVIRALQNLAPVLVENEAISAYIEEENRQDLRAALPELTTVAEAVSLATMEWRLTPGQQDSLRQLLEREVQASSNLTV